MRAAPRHLLRFGPRLAPIAAAGTLVLALGCGCAAPDGPSSSYSYFELPDARDPWTPKISGWQSREREVPSLEDLRAPAPVSDSGAREQHASADGTDLRAKYFAFRSDRKRALARELAGWIQSQAPDHYRADGPLDHWATLEETLAENGDDCDGLELLAYHFLRDMGFPEDEVFRAIVYRPEDGQHHMVTLWFETARDPWVIDPTGAMAEGMPRMSEVSGWVPLKVFSEDQEYTVQKRELSAARFAQATPEPAPSNPN